MSWEGALRFARYAVPPNQLGFCGPDEHQRLLGYGTGALEPDRGLHDLATGFDGAWPYLELLAGTAGTEDPLDDRVVEAYWIGNPLLDRVATNDWGWHLVDRFRPRVGADVDAITAPVGTGAVPNHAFHVLCVYPWVGMLRAGRGGDAPLQVIDQCRISWGVVRAVIDHTVEIEGPRLNWNDGRLSLSPAPARRMAYCHPSLGEQVRPGSVVATHWGTVCDRLDNRQTRWLAAITARQITIANQTGAAHRVG